MTPLQKGSFIAETAEYAEQYLLKKISALSAFSAMSFCSELTNEKMTNGKMTNDQNERVHATGGLRTGAQQDAGQGTPL